MRSKWPRYMHDFRFLTLEDAILRNRGEADQASERFLILTPAQKQPLVTFLDSL